jgi:RNA polymerase sigma factor (sigma-70 family)
MDSFDTYIESIKGFGRITKERERELSRIIRRSKNEKNVEKAQEELVHGNLFLVVDRAINLQKKYDFLGANLMDLIAEGNIALMIAAKNYRSDHKSNASFCSFAFQVIESKMIRAIRKDRFIYLPESYIKYRYDLNKLRENYRGKITDEVIKNELGISENMLEVLKEDVNKNAVFLEDVFSSEYGDDRNWDSLLEDTKTIAPFEKICESGLINYLNKYLSRLSEKEQQVMHEKYFTNSSASIAEIGRKLNVSAERIRQIHMVSLRKLRIYITKDWEAKNVEPETESMSSYSNYYCDSNYYGKMMEERSNKKQEHCDKAFKQILMGEQ